MWRHRARDFDAVIEYYIKRPNDRSGVNLEEKSFGFYLQQSDERCIFALHKICNIVLQIHKKDGKSQWHWHCDGKMSWFCNKKILIAEDLRDYKIFIRK